MKRGGLHRPFLIRQGTFFLVASGRFFLLFYFVFYAQTTSFSADDDDSLESRLAGRPSEGLLRLPGVIAMAVPEALQKWKDIFYEWIRAVNWETS